MTDEALPAPGARVRLRLDHWDHEAASTVDEQLGEDVVVTHPIVSTDEHGARVAVPAPGERVTLGWPTPLGWHEVVTSVVDVLGDSVPRWRLRPAGPVARLQRRAYARAAFHAPAVIEGSAATAGGVVVDLGEGGLRCHIEWGTPVFEPGDRVATRLTFADGAALVLAAEVVRTQQRSTGREVAVRFVDMTAHDADRIRHEVFEAERRHQTERGDDQ